MGKVLIILIFLGILVSLGSALFHMVKGGRRTDATAKALTIRISLSVGLFILLFILYALGVIEPHGVRP